MPTNVLKQHVRSRTCSLSASDKSVKNFKLNKIVQSNIKNDAIKQGYAKTNNFGYCIFWDDDISNWPSQISTIFSKENRTT